MRLLARLGVLGLIIAAVSALWWLDTQRAPEEARDEVPAQARHEPDHYFTDFHLRVHDGAAPPRYVLDGRRLVRYADDGSAEVSAPHLRYTPAGAPPWDVTGERGTLAPDGDRLDIDGDVVMTRVPDERDAVTIRTARMTVFTDAGRAQTDQPVTVDGTGWNVAAIGMTTLFGADQIELHRDVRGRYDPNHAQ